MLGPKIKDNAFDVDVIKGGRNLSQLMHWATGVKYSNHDTKYVRELFISYELWHLEGWTTFGEDAINDMIAEDAGRHLGKLLRKGEITNENLAEKLDEGFKESRAWVGKLLKLRQEELDKQIQSQVPVSYKQHWNGPQRFAWPTKDIREGLCIYKRLIDGEDIKIVKKDDFVQRTTDIYSLIYESENWEDEHGEILITHFSKSMVEGEYNEQFKDSDKIFLNQVTGIMKHQASLD